MFSKGGEYNKLSLAKIVYSPPKSTPFPSTPHPPRFKSNQSRSTSNLTCFKVNEESIKLMGDSLGLKHVSINLMLKSANLTDYCCVLMRLAFKSQAKKSGAKMR